MTEAKFHFINLKNVETIEIINNALNKANIEDCSNRTHQKYPAQIVFFDKIDLNLFDFLHSLNINSCQQILAVKVHDSVVPSNSALGLLQAGVKDLITWNYLTSPANEISERLARWY